MLRFEIIGFVPLLTPNGMLHGHMMYMELLGGRPRMFTVPRLLSNKSHLFLHVCWGIVFLFLARYWCCVQGCACIVFLCMWFESKDVFVFLLGS